MQLRDLGMQGKNLFAFLVGQRPLRVGRFHALQQSIEREIFLGHQAAQAQASAQFAAGVHDNLVRLGLHFPQGHHMIERGIFDAL